MHLLTLFFVLGVSFSQGKLDGLVAIVGDNIILQSDVLQQAQIFAASRKIDPTKSPYLFKQIYNETLENIINQYVILDVAVKDTNLIIFISHRKRNYYHIKIIILIQNNNPYI